MSTDREWLERQFAALEKKLRADLAAGLTRLVTVVQTMRTRQGHLQEQLQEMEIRLAKLEEPQQQRAGGTGPLLNAISVTGRMLARYFNEDELRDLCLELGVSFEAIEGETADAKARELASYMARRGRLGELIQRCVQLRPRVYGWPVQFIDKY